MTLEPPRPAPRERDWGRWYRRNTIGLAVVGVAAAAAGLVVMLALHRSGGLAALLLGVIDLTWAIVRAVRQRIARRHGEQMPD